MNRAVWTWMLVVLHGAAAVPAPNKHAVAVSSCKPKQMTALTRSQVAASLTSFDAANGNHLGTWSPGFPQLHLDHNTPLDGAGVQCSLLFMSQGVDAILVDQRDNLNPKDVSLHQLLNDTVSRIDLLAACVKSILGGSCASPPPPPQMPQSVFERKQWSHTLLKVAGRYLIGLERKIGVHMLKVKGSINQRQLTTRYTPVYNKEVSQIPGGNGTLPVTHPTS